MVYPSKIKTVTHPGTNRAWRRVTTLIDPNVLPLNQISNRSVLTITPEAGYQLGVDEVPAAGEVRDGRCRRVDRDESRSKIHFEMYGAVTAQEKSWARACVKPEQRTRNRIRQTSR